MASLFDFQNGGFGSQPKFPHPAAVTFLLGQWRDGEADWARDMAERTLIGMARGGIHDQLGGGFHRYSVDANWIVPHFEKMAYDNAELLKCYIDGFLALGNAEFAEAARGIIRWVAEVLADPAGGYGASQDADVGLNDDGDYFTWTLAEAQAAVGDADLLAVAAAYWDIGTAGEMHHDPAKNVLHAPAPLAAVAARLGLDVETAERRLAVGRQRMLVARQARTAPFVDRTRYTAWNGMLVTALLRAGAALGDQWPTEHALRTLARLREEQADPTRMTHNPGGVGGLLDDQVQMALALLEAFEVTADPQWLTWASDLLDRVWADFRDPAAGGLFDTAGAAGEGLLPTRVKPVQDAPTPSPNGVAALAAARLAELTGEARWASRRDDVLRAFAGAAAGLGIYGATYLQALDWSVRPATHLVIIEGEEPDAPSRADQMHRLALATFLPRRVVQRVLRGAAGGTALPAPVRAVLGGARGTRALACRGATCEVPAETLEAWRETLQRLTSHRH
jgi:uncharacterized protein YyaL (SSP411 family)